MALSYLSIRNKYFLSGFDWVMGVLDLIMRKTTCAGNASQIVIALDRPLDEALFRRKMEAFLAEFPVVAGRVARHWTLAPYWRLPGRSDRPQLRLTVSSLEGAGPDAVLSRLAEHINTPFPGEHDHLAFHIVSGASTHCLAMTFDHRLFDARGAESFLSLFQRFCAGASDVADSLNLVRSIDLTRWRSKFLAGQAINRKMIALSQEPVRALPISRNGSPRGFRYRVLAFDAGETKRITGKAFDEAGYLMVMPYLFSAVIEGMHRLFEQRGLEPGTYVIPVSTDLRRSRDIRQELFFNQNSMFLFQVRAGDAADRTRLLAAIKQQMYEQVQARLPEKLWEAASLMRIAPLRLLDRVFYLPIDGKIASFCFSHVSKCSYDTHELLGARMTNLFHMPRTPAPPGVGVFFNSFNGQLNATISWLDGLFTEEEMEMLERSLREGL